MKKNRELYKELYPKELAWCRENVEHFKNDKFLFDMYTILITGSQNLFSYTIYEICYESVEK
mgnify:CR=1 FL=1